jgi:hypothetical protein
LRTGAVQQQPGRESRHAGCPLAASHRHACTADPRRWKAGKPRLPPCPPPPPPPPHTPTRTHIHTYTPPPPSTHTPTSACAPPRPPAAPAPPPGRTACSGPAGTGRGPHQSGPAGGGTRLPGARRGAEGLQREGAEGSMLGGGGGEGRAARAGGWQVQPGAGRPCSRLPATCSVQRRLEEGGAEGMQRATTARAAHLSRTAAAAQRTAAQTRRGGTAWGTPPGRCAPPPAPRSTAAGAGQELGQRCRRPARRWASRSAQSEGGCCRGGGGGGEGHEQEANSVGRGRGSTGFRHASLCSGSSRSMWAPRASDELRRRPSHPATADKAPSPPHNSSFAPPNNHNRSTQQATHASRRWTRSLSWSLKRAPTVALPRRSPPAPPSISAASAAARGAEEAARSSTRSACKGSQREAWMVKPVV